MLGTAGQLFHDWSADYRLYSAPRVDPEALFAPVRHTLTARLAAGQPLVAALDDTRLRKRGRTIHGVQYVRDPLGPPFHVNFIRAQRFVQLSMAVPTATGAARMVPLDFVHAPAAPKPPATADAATQARYRQAQRDRALPAVGAERLHRLRHHLDTEGHRARPLWTVVDGGYTNRRFLKALPPHTVAIGRIRADAKLHHLPVTVPGSPGRRRIYGADAPTPAALQHDAAVPWQRVAAYAAGTTHQFRIKTLAPLRWRPAGPAHTLRLLVIAPLGYRLTQHGPLLYRQPAYLICTDPDLPLADILQAYVWRWDIEVNFRDEKTLLGVGQAQVRHPRSVETVPALAVAAYAMLLTSAIQAFGPAGHPHTIPAPKWRPYTPRRASTQSLIQHLRHEVWAHALRFSGFVTDSPPDTKPQKCYPSLAGALFYSSA